MRRQHGVVETPACLAMSTRFDCVLLQGVEDAQVDVVQHGRLRSICPTYLDRIGTFIGAFCGIIAKRSWKQLTSQTVCARAASLSTPTPIGLTDHMEQHAALLQRLSDANHLPVDQYLLSARDALLRPASIPDLLKAFRLTRMRRLYAEPDFRRRPDERMGDRLGARRPHPYP
jgi:hypothetical protein